MAAISPMEEETGRAVAAGLTVVEAAEAEEDTKPPPRLLRHPSLNDSSQ